MNETENYDVHFFGCSHMSDEEDYSYVYSHEIAERANRYDQSEGKTFCDFKTSAIAKKIELMSMITEGE